MKIRKKVYPSGRVGWQLDYTLASGRREQPVFRTRELAEAEASRVAAELRSSGESLLMIPASERAEIMVARDALARAGVTIKVAADYYLAKHPRLDVDPVRYRELWERCLESKAEQGLSSRYRTQLKSVWKTFGLVADEVMANEVSSEMIEAWLRSNGWGWRTCKNYRTDLRTLFEWAIEQGFAKENPVDAVAVRSRPSDAHGDDGGDVAFLSAGMAEKLLRRASLDAEGALRRDRRGQWATVDLMAEDYRLLVPSLVIGLFAGLRPEREIGKMTWRSVSIEDKLIIVTAGRAKSRSRRTVDLSDNAVAWLRWCRAQGMGEDESERILPKNYTRRWKRLRQATGLLKEWPHDGLRHTFATMHMAQHKSESLLQSALGHHNAELIYAHYRGLTTPNEAARFWSIMPPEEKKVDVVG